MNPPLRTLALPALLLLTLIYQPSTLLAQGTAFTYQGQLTSGTNVANGIYDLRFALFDALSAGTQIGPSRTNLALAVSNGFFAVTLDFTNGAFPGADRWLDIGVRSNGLAAFIPLTPRQKITPTPYAITASNLTGTVSAGGLSGTYSSVVTFNNAGNSFTGNGGGLTSLDASQLTGGTVPSAALANAWQITGNSGTAAGTHFVGTSDNQALELRVNGVRAMRIEPSIFNSPNLIGGSPVNFIATNVSGSFIGGGGTANFGIAASNRIASSLSVIVGGNENVIQANSTYAFIGGGQENEIQEGVYAVITGGHLNTMTNATWSFIGGGLDGKIDGSAGVIGGGVFNSIVSQSYGFIGGGSGNKIGGNTFGASGGGDTNAYDAIAGGAFNLITAGAFSGFIGGGRNNSITNGVSFATIPGGRENVAGGDYAFAAGRRAKARHDGTFVWADSTDSDFSSTDANQFLIRATGGVGINVTNPVDALHVQSVSSVRTRTTTTGTGFAGFLSENSLGEWFAGVASGTNHWYLFENAPSAGARVVVKSGGNVGIGTLAPTNKLHVAGGVSATALDVAGNVQAIQFLAVSGPAAAPGYAFQGDPNTGVFRPAVNALALANNGVEAVRIESGGNVGIGTNNPAQKLHVVGNILATGTITPNSDRNAKTDLVAVNTAAILERVAQLPIQQWRFNSENNTVKHVGPMAQDFRAAFGLGEISTAIATVDADGVALAAIQGLNEKVEASGQRVEGRIQKLEAENAELKVRLAKLERLMESKANGGAN